MHEHVPLRIAIRPDLAKSWMIVYPAKANYMTVIVRIRDAADGGKWRMD